VPTFSARLAIAIVVGASFNPELARDGGAMLGRVARIRRVHVMLAAGSASPATYGRSFEYYSEDLLRTARDDTGMKRRGGVRRAMA
jgi:beta-glucosidase